MGLRRGRGGTIRGDYLPVLATNQYARDIKTPVKTPKRNTQVI
jgi:hypothetical protein